ncbi:hypothetical protein ACJBYX_07215 [Streptococcus suis]|uniref:hypothetical protein n=1 Tax=Streptococcus suis TaxID=1307 RepID=UPI001146E169|nr:hypothetical protein [Streptococcus suis]MCH1638017.1 hypothetical protein [Streptococcus suis]MCH1648844.1 hypothetical protein [Streptococcus suis]NQI85186.1 hypothetical protein [Streptococcus suis]NQK19018.1 hypothetical protein [Streptococcus suis]TQE44936.1 hypothetical protein FH690_08935 [Streptococcus suis]
MINREAKKFFDYYLKIVETEEYRSDCRKHEQEGLEFHRKYIEEKHPEWVKRTDYFDEFSIGEFLILDTLSNEGVNKLTKRLYSLPKSKFKVKNYYKKPTIFKKYDYVHLQYLRHGVGIFAEIEILEDSFFSSIEISWSMVNNYYAIFQYRFHFKQVLTDSNRQLFISDNIKKLSKKDYINWYSIDNEHDSLNYLSIKQMSDEFPSIICQHYITTYLYSEKGKTNKLINLAVAFRKEKVDIDKIYLGDISYSLYNKKGNYYISNSFHDSDYVLYSGSNIIPRFSILGSISQYGNELYYLLFGERELHIFERDFSKYISGRKSIMFNKNFLNLLKKIQSLSESENRVGISNLKKDFENSWTIFVSNDEVQLEKLFHKDLSYYRNVIKENYSYLNMLTEINYTKTNTISSIVATIVSIIATILSVLALLG